MVPVMNIVSFCRGIFTLKNQTYLDLVPIFTGEGIQGLLLQTLLALRETLIPIVLSDSIFSIALPLVFHLPSIVARPLYFDISIAESRE